MNTFFIIKQLFIHSQIDEKVLSGDSLFFYVSVILFLKKERFTSDVSCNCIWFYCFYEDSGDQAVSARDILVMEGNPGDWYMWQTGKYYGRWFTAGESVGGRKNCVYSFSCCSFCQKLYTRFWFWEPILEASRSA